MRRILLVLAVAACTHSAATGPAWPKQHAKDDDGGESLAPRDPAKSVAVAAETSDDDAKPAATDAPAEKPAAAPAADGGAAAAAPATAQPEDVIQTEEIVIEVGPDD
jgi:hypothetical protein